MKLLLAAAAVLIGLALAISLSRRTEAPPAAAAELPPGWGSVVLGAPSAAIPPPQDPAPVAQSAPQPAAQPASQPAPAREEELVVEPGQSLSMLCKSHYGTASVALVEALARFNGLSSPDAVRAGQTLRLPPLETLQKR